MEEEMKHDFYVPVVRQVTLDNVHLRNGHISQNFDEESMFIFYSKNDQKCSNKMIDFSGK